MDAVARAADEPATRTAGHAPARRPTIADVARAAGVSKGAVSFALNGRPGVAPGTRDRILATAGEPRLVAQPPRARPVELALARRRAGARPFSRDPRQRPVLPGVHRRRRDRALAGRPGPGAAGRARPGRRAWPATARWPPRAGSTACC
nr:LacI family DNA-binding transcriptional regulator [Angustibacter aerolatus]